MVCFADHPALGTNVEPVNLGLGMPNIRQRRQNSDCGGCKLVKVLSIAIALLFPSIEHGLPRPVLR